MMLNLLLHLCLFAAIILMTAFAMFLCVQSGKVESKLTKTAGYFAASIVVFGMYKLTATVAPMIQ